MGFECDLGIIARVTDKVIVRVIAYNCILPSCLVSINKQSSLVPSPTPRFIVLQATKSWVWDCERGYKQSGMDCSRGDHL